MMPKRVQVIKQHQVEFSGSVCLSPSGRMQTQAGAALHGPMPSCGTPQQARVVESNSEYAILEVICSCGNKSYIQCNYAHLSEGS